MAGHGAPDDDANIPPPEDVQEEPAPPAPDPKPPMDPWPPPPPAPWTPGALGEPSPWAPPLPPTWGAPRPPGRSPWAPPPPPAPADGSREDTPAPPDSPADPDQTSEWGRPGRRPPLAGFPQVTPQESDDDAASGSGPPGQQPSSSTSPTTPDRRLATRDDEEGGSEETHDDPTVTTPEPPPTAQDNEQAAPAAPQDNPTWTSSPRERRDQDPWGPSVQEAPTAADAGWNTVPRSSQWTSEPRRSPAPSPALDDLPPSMSVPRSTPQPPRPGPRPAVPSPVEHFEPWRIPAPRRRGTRLRPILIGLTAAAVIAVVAAGAVVVLGRHKDTPAPAGPPARLAGSVFAPLGSAKTDGRDQELNAIAGHGSTVVAAGGEFGTLNYRAEFLVSSDGGRSFALADVRTPAGQEPPFGDVPRVIGGGARGWVALGGGSPGTTAVWTSRDGRVWTRQPDSAGTAFGRNDRIFKVTPTSSGFVAVGDTSAKGDFSDATPVVWLSSDGRRWDRSSSDELKMTLGDRPVSLVDVAAVGSTVIAYGWSTKDGKIAADGVWRSADGGHSWAPVQVPQPKGTAPAGITIAATSSGFLAVRGAARLKDTKVEFYGLVLSSTDGQRWAQTGELDLPGFRNVLRLAGSDRGLAAVVKTKDGLVLARSLDGRSWHAAGDVPMPDGRTVQGVAATASATLVAARDAGGDDVDAVLTARDDRGKELPVDLSRVPGAILPDQAVSGVTAGSGRVVAVGGTNGDAAVWSSADGNTWTRAQGEGNAFSRPSRQRLVSAAHGQAGWLAVGYDGPPPSRPLVVTSANGTTWRAADADRAFEPAKGASLLTFAAGSGPSGYVIVGEDGPSAATWHSKDLKSWRRGTGELAGRPTARRWLRGVVGGPFGYVAVGGLEDPSAPNALRGRPVVWTSTDGGAWVHRQLPLPKGADQGWLEKVVARGDVLVAVGSASSGPAQRTFAVVSADGGRHWQQAALPDADSGNVLVTAATATPNGFVVTGAAGRWGQTDVVVWSSRDGRTWRLDRPRGTGLSGRGDQWLSGVTTVGGDLLAVGFTADHRGERPVLWRRPVR